MAFSISRKCLIVVQAVEQFSEENSKTYIRNVIEVINKIKKKQKGQKGL